MSTEANRAAIGIIGMLVLFVVYLLAGPFITIWSLNELFHFEIPYTFKTWCAVVWILMTLNSIKFSLKKE